MKESLQGRGKERFISKPRKIVTLSFKNLAHSAPRRNRPTPQILPSLKLINLIRPPLRLRTTRRLHLLLNAASATHAHLRFTGAPPMLRPRFRRRITPLALLLPLMPIPPRPRPVVLVRSCSVRIIARHAADAGVFGSSAPAVAAGEDVFDALVGGELAGLGGPGGGQRAPVHVLQFADFARLGRHGGHVAEVVGLGLFGGHDAGDAAEDGGGFEGGARVRECGW